MRYWIFYPRRVKKLFPQTGGSRSHTTGNHARISGCFCEMKAWYMVWYVVSILASLVFDVFRLIRMSPDEKDVEILLLRQQLMMIRRRQKRGPNSSRVEKVMLITLFTRLYEVKRSSRSYIERHILLFRPDTILRWHRDLVRKKWTVTNQPNTAAVHPCLQKLKHSLFNWHEKMTGEQAKSRANYANLAIQ